MILYSRMLWILLNEKLNVGYKFLLRNILNKLEI